MASRRETLAGTIEWFQLHWPRDPRYFESPKVVIPSMFAMPRAAYVPENAYFGLGSNVLVGGDAHFTPQLACALFNSRLGSWWFITNGKQRSVGVDIGVDRLRQFPLPPMSKELSKVKPLVDRITAARLKDADVHASAIESEIDQLVYALYGLSKGDIEIVESLVN